jgi:hypothetical protein
MKTPQATSELGRRKALAAVLIAAGFVLIATSFILPSKGSQRAAWSTDQAKQYQAASSKLHSLSHEIATAKPDRQAAIRDDLHEARAEYASLRNDLDAALSRPRRSAWTLRIIGLISVAIGGVLLFRLPESDE